MYRSDGEQARSRRLISNAARTFSRLWETSPTSGTAVFTLSGLDGGTPLTQIDLSSLLFEGTLAPASAQLTGGAPRLQLNKTDLLRALRKRIGHPFTDNEVERVQLTGRLTDGRILRTGVDITIQTPLEQIETLREKVRASTIGAGRKNSLLVKLDGETGVCGKLNAFISEVTSQRGKGIPAALANEWIADATRIQSILECG